MLTTPRRTFPVLGVQCMVALLILGLSIPGSVCKRFQSLPLVASSTRRFNPRPAGSPAPMGRSIWFYAHLEPGSVAVQAGERVRQGQQIGRLGNSGSSDGPHLHFHVMDQPSALVADGVPYVFAEFDLTGQMPPLAEVAPYYEAQESYGIRVNPASCAESTLTPNRHPQAGTRPLRRERGDVVRQSGSEHPDFVSVPLSTTNAGPRQDELPLGGDVVTFPDVAGDD